MIYGWIIGGLAALDLGVKSVVEGQEDETFPRELPSAKGLIKLHKNHNSGFPFGFMKERPELVKGIPLMVISAMAGALAAMMQDKGKTGEKLGLSLVMGGALSNLYDRVLPVCLGNNRKLFFSVSQIKVCMIQAWIAGHWIKMGLIKL